MKTSDKRPKGMKILVVGGGSGGHITPAVAVVRELLEKRPRAQVEFWTDRKYYKNVVKITTEIGVRWGSEDLGSGKKVPYIRVRKVCAGKFRRYAGWTWKDWFRNWRIVLKDLVFGNIAGFFGFIGGIIQSFWRLLWPSKRPDVIFLKGGFVGLPVGLVARKLKVPYVVHESDAVPGLANRVLMEHATVIATGWAGLDLSKLKKKDGTPLLGATEAEAGNVVQVGIPVAPEYTEVDEAKQRKLKQSFGFDPEKTLVVVTGGSQGAENINVAMTEILPEMLKFTNVGLVAGRKHYENMVDLKRYEEWDKAKLKSGFRMWEFNSAMYELMGAADVVVSRAGATTIAELAALSKAVVLVPFERLPGAHQLRNAEKLKELGAVLMVGDEKIQQDPKALLEEVRHLIRAPREREELAKKLHAEAMPDAAEKLAAILIDIADGADMTVKETGEAGLGAVGSGMAGLGVASGSASERGAGNGKANGKTTDLPAFSEKELAKMRAEQEKLRLKREKMKKKSIKRSKKK